MKTATILTIIGLVLSFGAGAALWTHDHSKALPVANKAAVVSLAMSDRIGDQLRVYDNRAHDWNMSIAKKEGQIFDLKKMMSEDPQIIQWQNELESELEGYRRLLQQLQERIRHEEKLKQSLMRKLATA